MKTQHTLRAMLATAALAALTVLPASGITLEGQFNGTTRYVSKSGNDSNGGTSWDDAKLTIQAAVNLCNDGDTVIVDDGEYSDTTPWTATAYNNPCVVNITKRIHLVSRNGKHRTHIVGQWSSASAPVANDGNAHRCIYIDGPNNAVGTLIEGFTIRDGATAGAGTGNNAVDSAGGVCGGATSAIGAITGYIVDCDIVNCRAGIGAALSRGIIPIRCAFVGNRAVASGAQPHVIYRTSYAYDCVFSGNGSGTRSTSNNDGLVFPGVQSVTVVNCTFADNTCYGFAPNGSGQISWAYNCAFLGAGEAATFGVVGGKAYFYPTNCVQTANGTDDKGRIAAAGAAAGCKVGVDAFQTWYAADAGEWKAVVGGDLKDAGFNARSVAATFVPEEYLDTDFFGNPRNWASVDIGAIEAQGDAADPDAGTIQLGTGVALREGEDVISMPRAFVGLASGMRQVRLVPTIGDSTPLFGYSCTGAWGDFYRYPDLGADRGAWMTPPASGESVAVNAKTATDEKWVDGGYAGGDSDGSEAKPYITITDAAEAIAEFGLVHVAPGTYDTGSKVPSGHTIHSRVLIDKSVAVRSSEGAAATVIKGDANTRCVTVRRQALDVHFQGFTIADGTANADNTTAGACGGGFYTTAENGVAQTWSDDTGLSFYSHSSQVTDCIFSGNTARQGAAICGGWAQRCVFTGNKMGATARTIPLATSKTIPNLKGRGAVTYSTFLSACVVTNNLQDNTAAICSVYYSAPYNVTFAEPDFCSNGSTAYRAFDMWTPAFNCAIIGSQIDNPSAAVKVSPAGNVADNAHASHTARTWLAVYAENELFADPDGGDLHLKTATDASTKGDATAYRAAMFAVGDFEGNALAYVDGNPVPGAYSTLLEGVDLYVDATSGNDTNDGRSASAAKKTLAAALALAHTGDTVHAAPGDYAEGTMTHMGGTILIAPLDGIQSPSRGVVPEGVALVADDGPDVTFITGATDDANGNGLGANAVRCLTALAGSKVAGFTLRGGSTFNTTGAMRDENVGGLAIAPSCRHGESGTAVFEDCVFTNGFARTAGDVAGGIFRRSRLYGGQVTAGAAISMYSRFEHCLLVNTDDDDTGVRACGGMASCTYVNTQGKASGQNAELGDSLFEYGASFENSVIATLNKTGGDLSPVLQNMTNCLFVTGGGNATVDSATCVNVTTVATVADALAMLNEDYAPLAGSALVNAGDRALLAKLAGGGETDLAGGQRIYGGQVDIGAFEYDLRPDIARALNRRVSVSAAGEEVVLADGAVRIPDGEVAATITDAQAGSFLLPVEVTGTGTLSIYLGASDTPWQTLTAADGAQQLKLTTAAGTTPLRFAYAPGAADAGYASIGALASTNPFVLVVR